MSTRDTYYAVGATVFNDRQGVVKHFPMPYAAPGTQRAQKVSDFAQCVEDAYQMAKALNGTGPRAERARKEVGL